MASASWPRAAQRLRKPAPFAPVRFSRARARQIDRARPHANAADDSPRHSGFSCMYKTRSPCAHRAGVALTRPAPPQACLTPNSTPNSRPKSRRVKPCPNSTAAASSVPC
jgi:hypothetical protein